MKTVKSLANCQRTVIWENGTAREVKSFGGTPEKGCGKFLPKKESRKHKIHNP